MNEPLPVGLSKKHHVHTRPLLLVCFDFLQLHRRIMPLSDAWIDFVAGWCSGAAAVLVCQPVDTVLTRLQAGTVSSLVTGTTRATTTTTTARTATLDLTQSAGFQALWRGASPMITAVPLQNALLMGGYGVGQAYSAGNLDSADRLAAIFVGGCTGGILQSFLMSPVELIKVSQQVRGTPLRDAGGAVLTHWAQPAAWRGLYATLLRDGIPHGVWFATYEVAKDGLEETLGKDSVSVPLASGALAATAAWAVGYPADLIKTRIQAASPTENQGIVETARAIMNEGNAGVAGLYRGFGLKLVRSIPASMIGFTVYEFVKKQVQDRW